MAAGLADRLWDMRDIVVLVKAAEDAEGPRKRDLYKPRQPKAAQQGMPAACAADV